MRPPRLDRSQYKGAKSVAFTCHAEQGERPFTSAILVFECVAHLRKSAVEFHCNLPIYCFMPDHIHLMFQGREFESDPLAAMEKFKWRMSQTFLKQGLRKMQSSFYDHIIRAGEDWRNQARYFALNPVRAGLVEHFSDYPFLGSLHGDITDLFL